MRTTTRELATVVRLAFACTCAVTFARTLLVHSLWTTTRPEAIAMSSDKKSGGVEPISEPNSMSSDEKSGGNQ